MSPRRRLLLVALAVLAAAGVLAGVLAALPGAPSGPDRGPVAQDRPGPVLLVPGYGGDRASLQTLAERLRAQGREATVLRLDGDGTGDLNAQVRVLDRAATAAVRAGAPSVDVVGYSAGGVVAGLWVARSGGPEDRAAPVRRVVTLGAPLSGTGVAASAGALTPDACPRACRQLAPGSTVLAELDRADVGRAVPWLSVWTAQDEIVTPPSSARLEGAVNVELQRLCPDARVSHGELPEAPAVTGLVVRALSTAPIAAAPADCATLRAAGRAVSS